MLDRAIFMCLYRPSRPPPPQGRDFALIQIPSRPDKHRLLLEIKCDSAIIAILALEGHWYEREKYLGKGWTQGQDAIQGGKSMPHLLVRRYAQQVIGNAAVRKADGEHVFLQI